MKPAEPGPTSNLALTDTGNWAQTLCSQAHPAPSLPLQTHRQTDTLPAPPWRPRPAAALPPAAYSLQARSSASSVHPLCTHSASVRQNRCSHNTEDPTWPRRGRAHPAGPLLVRGSGPTPRTRLPSLSPPCSPRPARLATGKTPCDEVMLAATCPGLEHTHTSRWRQGGGRRHRVPQPGRHPWVAVPRGESCSWALGRLFLDTHLSGVRLGWGWRGCIVHIIT